MAVAVCSGGVPSTGRKYDVAMSRCRFLLMSLGSLLDISARTRPGGEASPDNASTLKGKAHASLCAA